MKSLSIAVLVAAIGASAIPNPQTFCTEECRPTKPVCPSGQAPTGNEACWGCCQPITPSVCIQVCHADKPVCPPGEAPTGIEGCWGCCLPISTLGGATITLPTVTPAPSA